MNKIQFSDTHFTSLHLLAFLDRPTPLHKIWHLRAKLLRKFNAFLSNHFYLLTHLK